MANTLTNVLPKILSRGLLALREQAIMPRIVNGDYSNEAAAKGNTIDVPIPTAQAAVDVVPSNTPPANTDTTPGKVQIALNNWKKTSFQLSDKDLIEIDRNAAFMPMQVSEAIRSLSNVVNVSLHTEYKGVYGYPIIQTDGAPMSDIRDATKIRQVLNYQRAPLSDRRAVLDFATEAAALALPAFSNFEQTGDMAVKIEGNIGRKIGFDWFADDAVLTHVSTALTAGAATVNGVNAAGSLTVSIAKATNTSPLVVGDILQIAGQPTTYVVTAAATLAVGNTAVSIYPPLALATAGAEVVKLAPTHTVALAFHRDAFAFANRPLALSTADVQLGSQIMSMTDPQTGISLRLEVSRQYKQVTWEFDILWGVKLVRPELATRIPNHTI